MALPAGTVTFLFTDIEGSTALLHEHGGRYADILSEHRRILRAAFAEHGGTEVDTQGDAFFVAFPTAQGALRAAEDAQSGLATGPVRVRMGIHTGTPVLTEEGYVGVEVHRAARIGACGHGGQVLVSAPAAALLDAEDLHDLGEHRLKDLGAPERIYQLGTAEFPPLKSLYRTNLPIPATPFLGREHELAEVLGLLARDEVRLLTLTGPGGMGKTRLGLQAAAGDAERHPDGVFWVPLAALRDPTLVLEAAAQALGAKKGLVEHVADKSLLLLFDNFEHVIDAAGGLSELLAACPSLQLLVTSREALRVPGEHAYPVPPLEPKDGSELFVARARAALPGFVASEAVAELCVRLEQLPLAIELAAARSTVLSPAQLLERLAGRLDLLKAGRGVDARQQTLRATIDWSYELLNADEQRLFARLAMFRGGCTLEAAESVAEADLDTLQRLVEKSLLRQTDERFWMLETIREYAVERLEEDGAEAGRRRHAWYFLEFAEHVESELAREQQAEWVQLTERDYSNLRVALAWFAEAHASQPGLRLAGALRPFWFKKGYLGEARRWLVQFLESADEPTPARAKALGTAALVGALQGDWREAKRRGTEGRRLGLELGEHRYACWSMLALGRALLGFGDHAGAVTLFEEAGRVGRQNDDLDSVAHAAFNLGYTALNDGDLDRARAEFEVAVTNADDDQYAAHAGVNILARSLAALGSVALRDGRHADSVRFLRDSLQISTELRERDDTVAWTLELLGVALSGTDPEQAVQVLGTAEALRDELGARLQGIELDLHEQALAALRTTLGPRVLADAWATGHNLSLEETLAQAFR